MLAQQQQLPGHLAEQVGHLALLALQPQRWVVGQGGQGLVLRGHLLLVGQVRVEGSLARQGAGLLLGIQAALEVQVALVTAKQQEHLPDQTV